MILRGRFGLLKVNVQAMGLTTTLGRLESGLFAYVRAIPEMMCSQGKARAARGMSVVRAMTDEVRTVLPAGVDPVESWTYSGVDCAVGAVGRSLYGLARIRHFARGWASSVPSPTLAPDDREVLSVENLGDWVAFVAPRLSGFWSPEALSRMTTPASSEFVAWDVSGHTWAIHRLQAEVNEFVDAILRDVPHQRDVGTSAEPASESGESRSDR